MPQQVQRLRAENARLQAQVDQLRMENQRMVQAMAQAGAFTSRAMLERRDDSMRRRGRVTRKVAEFMGFCIQICEFLDPNFEDHLRELFHQQLGHYPEDEPSLQEPTEYLPSSDEEAEPEPEGEEA